MKKNNFKIKKKSPDYTGLFFYIKDILKKILNIFRFTIFINKCKICDEVLVYDDEKYICNVCKEELRKNEKSVCKLCGKLIREETNICGECSINPPNFNKHISFGVYDGKLRELILKSKYKKSPPLNKFSSKLLLEVLPDFNGIEFDYIIPVPMDIGRKRKYNHNLEISSLLSKKSDILLETNNLIKIKKTDPQVGLTMAKRKKNLDGAFKINDKNRLKNKNILLIDDVYTTGTTIKKCSAEIIKSGGRVFALTLARTK